MRNTVTGRVLKLDVSKGYHRVYLGRNLRRLAHWLVLESFVGPAPEGHECNHDDGVKTNNQLGNLAWVTKKENQQHSVRVLGKPSQTGSKHGMSKLTEDTVREMRARVADGEPQQTMVRDYNVSAGTVSMIVNRKKWKHV